MKSICPTSKMFDPKAGTAEEQLGRMIDAAQIVGSRIVRAVLGSSDDRLPGPIERHIESTVQVLRNMRSKVMDARLKIAIENHAGDMQARELKTLIEGAGRDFVGVCLDSGNPLWTLEDPHLTLETLHPYVLTSHVRDSAVWQVPEGAAVAWVRMGEGNVNIDDYVRKYAGSVPGPRAVAGMHRHRAARISLSRSQVLGCLPQRRRHGNSSVFAEIAGAGQASSRGAARRRIRRRRCAKNAKTWKPVSSTPARC